MSKNLLICGTIWRNPHLKNLAMKRNFKSNFNIERLNLNFQPLLKIKGNTCYNVRSFKKKLNETILIDLVKGLFKGWC